MDLIKIQPERAPSQLRAMTTVARAATSGLDRPQRALLDAIQRVVLESDLDLETVEPIGAPALARDGREPAEARQLIRMMAMVSIADGPPSAAQMALIEAFATALSVDEPAVRVLDHLSKGHGFRFRIGFARRAHVRTYLRNTHQMLGGVVPVIAALLRFRGVLEEDAELARRFRALADLPVGTLGRVFHDHCRAADIPFAGEKGGFPIGAVYHDFSHVLSGSDTSPEGEIKNAAFQAGFCRGEEDFFTTLFANLIHTAGVNLTPFEIPIRRGRIAEGTLALDWIREIERGSAVKIDLGDGWNFWEEVERPIDGVREKLGIRPVA